MLYSTEIGDFLTTKYTKMRLLDRQLSDIEIEAILEECLGQNINEKFQGSGL